MHFGMTDAKMREDRPWWVHESPHYLFMFDEVACKMCSMPRFAGQAERRLNVISSIVGLKKHVRRYPLGRRIPYFVHDPQRCRYGNVDVGGIDVPAGGDTTFYQHEEAHAVLGVLVDSVPSLFNEGFAKFAESPSSEQNHRIALAGLKHGELASLASIVEFRPFWDNWKVRGGFVYPQAGSFVGYLLGCFGSKRFLEFCISCSQDDPRRRILRSFRRAFGVTLPDVERRWKSFLITNDGRFWLRSGPKISGSTEPHWVQRTLKHIEQTTGDRRRTGKDGAR